MVTRSNDLGLRYESTANEAQNARKRQRWYKHIAEATKEYPREWPIGIVTHKAIEDEAVAAIRELGFTDVRSRHYGDERGSNVIEDCRVLVLLGLPIPNEDDFKEEAQAYFFDNDELLGNLDFTWENKEQFIQLRNGLQVPVEVGGYWNEPVASYYRQKCQAGLYQALHRIRPYIPKEYDRHILVYTNMPIEDVLVDNTLGNREGRLGRAITALSEELETRGECTVPELSELIRTNGQSDRTVEQWVRSNSVKLAEQSNSTFTSGDRRRPGRFARSD